MDNLLQPISEVKIVDRDLLKPNDYNPNKVMEDNLKLLMQSIKTNGWTLPIVVRPDYTIIDGFHRWTVSGREPLKTELGKIGRASCREREKISEGAETVERKRRKEA